MLTRVLPAAWALALSVLLLGPALGPGYVLSYDMVWVPDLSLHADVFGLGSGLPRAVPSDAVVGLLDEIVPGMVLQKLVLLGALVLAGTGAARLVAPPDRRALVARLTAVSLAVWSPFVVERLWLGHWPMLLAYAAAPWLALAGARAALGRVPPWTYVVLLLGSLSASAGIVSGLVLLATGVRRSRAVTARLLIATLAANAPWVVAGLAHATIATSAGGYRVFGLHRDGLPAPLAALTLGGVWNADVVPGSRRGWLVWLALAFLVVLAGAGVRRWLAWTRPDQRIALGVLWLLGIGLAVVSWAAPGALAWLGDHVAGAGVLRDGSRMLPLCLPLLVTLVAAGADQAVSALAALLAALGARATVPAAVSGVVLALLPVLVLPDAAWGVGGAVRASAFPAEWSQVRTVLADARLTGDVLILPWSAYRAPRWNRSAAVLDPLPRMLTRDSVSSDVLLVDGREVAGEDPRDPGIERALAQPSAAERASALGAVGIGAVVTERDAGTAPAIAGPALHDGPLLRVQRIDAPVRAVSTGPGALGVAATIAGWVVYAGFALVALVALATPARWPRKKTRLPPSQQR